MDLFPPRQRARRLTDLDEVEFRTRFQNSSVLKTMVSMTVSYIDMNIHVCAKLAGHDVT